MSPNDKISKIIRKCKLELYKAFGDVDNYRYWWKEEDLQSYLYHLLLMRLPDAIKIVHREYPLLEKLTSPWGEPIGKVDLAILEPVSDEFNVATWKIRHAIELKFPLRRQGNGTVRCDDTRDGFARGYYKDYKKLLDAKKKAKNVSENFQVHILFFEKFADEKKSLIKSPPDSGDPCKEFRKYVKKWVEERGKEFDLKEFDRIEFSYMEVYPNGEHSDLFNNWPEKKEV